jgi:ribose-phosphate pyrophosphokinase
MILFAFSYYESMARQLREILDVKLGRFTVTRFHNQELYAVVEGPVAGQHCLVLGSIAPPDEQVLSVLLLAHTLRKEGADKLTAILPYLAYSRQDKAKPGESLATAWVGSLLKTSGFDQVLTVDVHSERDKKLFPIPVTSLSTASLFAAAIRNHQLHDAVIVAPDNGAIPRCEAVKCAAGMPAGDTPHFEKQRTEKGIVHRGPIGKVGPRVVIIDDMLDTGETLASACEKLKAAKVEEIYILVTHGLFTGTKWTQLWSLGVKHIFCADTVPLRADIDATNISILPVSALLHEELSSMDEES